MSRNNENKPPLPIQWGEEYWARVPVCPACGDITDSLEQCKFCGQKFLPDEAVRERRKISRYDCLLCGGKKTMVCTRVEYNGHLRGKCASCGAAIMG